MSDQPERIAFREFLKLLRPNLRLSLAQKEISGFLRHQKRLEIFDHYEMQGRSLEARERILPIIDATEYVKGKLEAESKADDRKPDDSGQPFWEYWDERYGVHRSAESDEAGLKEFWKHWGTDLETVEVRVSCQARIAYENHQKNGFDPGVARYLKDEYAKWRQAETSRQRANNARIKAVKAAAAEIIKSLKILAKRLARQRRPHLSSAGRAEIEMDKSAFEEFFAREDTTTDKAGWRKRFADADPAAVKKALEEFVAGNDTTRDKTDLKRLVAKAKPETVKKALEEFASNCADIKTA